MSHLLDQRAVAVLCLVRESRERGVTRDELAAKTNWPLQTVCWRVRDLIKVGLIVASASKRQTRSGRLAEILIAKISSN